MLQMLIEHVLHLRILRAVINYAKISKTVVIPIVGSLLGAS